MKMVSSQCGLSVSGSQSRFTVWIYPTVDISRHVRILEHLLYVFTVTVEFSNIYYSSSLSVFTGALSFSILLLSSLLLSASVLFVLSFFILPSCSLVLCLVCVY